MINIKAFFKCIKTDLKNIIIIFVLIGLPAVFFWTLALEAMISDETLRVILGVMIMVLIGWFAGLLGASIVLTERRSKKQYDSITDLYNISEGLKKSNMRHLDIIASLHKRVEKLERSNAENKRYIN